MKGHYHILTILLCCASLLSAQEITKPSPATKTADKKQRVTANDLFSRSGSVGDSLDLAIDTTALPRESTVAAVDSLRTKRMSLTISEDAPEAKITYGAQDTQWLEKATSKVHLFGDAYVKYEDYEIKAGYIIFSFDDNTAYAESITDPDGKPIGKPSFTDGAQNFTYNRLKYNFKTKKGIVYDAVTTEGEFFVHGAKTKFVSGESDSLQQDDAIYNQNALITTCNHDHPHFGIRARKLKVIPQKMAVIGPANLEIGGVPTPLWLPFGFFPIAGGTSDGLIFPSDYKYDQRWGFGLLEVGYYFPINDFVDLRLTGDIYTRGSYGLRALSNYKKRYKYGGFARLGYSDTREEDAEGITNSQKSFSIYLSHKQSSKAHPYRSFNGTIDFQTGDYRARNNTDAGTQFQNIYSSSLNYEYNFPDKPLTLNVGLSGSQNTRTDELNITLPDATLTMRSLKPFQKKNRGGNEEKWYEKIVVSYTGKAKSFIRTTDSLVFTKEALDDLQYGISHDVSTNVSLTAFKYFTFAPRIDYDEIWFFRTLGQDIDPNFLELDTVQIDILPDSSIVNRIDTTFVPQESFANTFKPYRNIDISFRLNTQLFGVGNFSKGPLKGIRHHMKPSLTFKYVPETQEKYQEFYYTDLRPALRDSVFYNPFSGGVFGTPRLAEEQLSLVYGLTNIFEGKYWSKKDSLAKKFRIFDNISINGNYNFAADSLKWSTVAISGNTKLFKGMTDFRFGLNLDPYLRDENGREIATTVWSDRKRPVQFRNGNASFTTRLTFKQIFDVLKGKEPSDEDVVMSNNASRDGTLNRDLNPRVEIEEEIDEISDEDKIRNKPDLKDDQEPKEKKAFEPQRARFLDLISNFKLNHTIGWIGERSVAGRDSFYLNTNSLSLEGTFNITDNWNIRVERITYDFRNKSLVYPSFRLVRKLHCWNMNIAWQPSAGSYSFFIGVQSSSLSFLKYQHGQNNIPNSRFGP